MSNATLTIPQLEQLLSLRSPHSVSDENTLSTPTLEQVAASLERAMLCEAARDEVSNMDDLQLSMEAIELFMSIRDEELFEHEESVVPLRPKQPVRLWVMAAAAVVVVSAAVALAVQWFVPTADVPAESTLTPKGMAHDFRIAVSRNGTQFSLNDGDMVKTGDYLGFFYTAPVDGYLAVFYTDDQGNVSPLHPASGQRSVSIGAGAGVQIPDGAKVTPSTGCEWIVAVFMDTSRSLQEIQKEIQTTMNADKSCNAHFSISGSTRVRVQQIRGETSK